MTDEGAALCSREGVMVTQTRLQIWEQLRGRTRGGACSPLPPGVGRRNCKAFPPASLGPRTVKGRETVSSMDGEFSFYPKTETFRTRRKIFLLQLFTDPGWQTQPFPPSPFPLSHRFCAEQLERVRASPTAVLRRLGADMTGTGALEEGALALLPGS